jgi:hypothetical protein
MKDEFFHCDSCDWTFACFQSGVKCHHPESMARLMSPSPHYYDPTTSMCFIAVNEFYKGKSAERSGVPYINHIREGLTIMEARGASTTAMNAYCLHPLIQNDKDFVNALDPASPQAKGLHLANPSLAELLLASEYRRVANSYLSKDPDPIVMTILTDDLKEMLIADKVQNRKDFELHQADHPRHLQLKAYFESWIRLLGITEAEYSRLTSLISQ